MIVMASMRHQIGLYSWRNSYVQDGKDTDAATGMKILNTRHKKPGLNKLCIQQQMHLIFPYAGYEQVKYSTTV